VPDVHGKKVLVFGDSLSAGQFSPGKVMAGQLDGAAEVRINARVLAAIRAFDPDLIVVVLGTNDIGLSMAKDKARMNELRDAFDAGGAEVWAFGPPSFAAGTREQAGSTAVVSMMKSVFGDRFLDLRPLTADLTASASRTTDRVHFTATGGKVAGDRMADRFLRTDDRGGDGWVLLAAAITTYFLLR
jgi:lysophospholipase L1-like esterase